MTDDLRHLALRIANLDIRLGRHEYLLALAPADHDPEEHGRDRARLQALLERARELIDGRLACLDERGAGAAS